jgi:hypothetical protein
MNGTSDFFEIDFIKVETKKSGDAIALRYQLNGITVIHVVDGGYQETGQTVVDNVRSFYGDSCVIDHVVATHPDGDHLGGLRVVLESCPVRELWMLRPWLYAQEIIHRFDNVTSVDYLVRLLKEAYPNVAALEEIATQKGIAIREPFQGAAIGAFHVLGPTKSRYLNLIVTSEKTPPSSEAPQKSAAQSFLALLERGVKRAISLARALWGQEVFSDEDISAENKMSVMQYSLLCSNKVLLTADAGLDSFAEAAAYAPSVGLSLPGIDRFQVPHHGSRRSVSNAMWDKWLGQRLPVQLPSGQEKFRALISSAKADTDHPRKAVIRAMIHRGAKVIATEGRTIRTQVNAPDRPGWTAVEGEPYPQEQEK